VIVSFTLITGVHGRKDREDDRFDVKQDYLKLKVAYTDLILMVPVANAESVGLREVINDEEGRRGLRRVAQEGSAHADQLVASFQEPLREVRSATSTKLPKSCATSRSVTRTRACRR